jgi:3-methyl-2-oxobutanoate hydroxymethyltransferase
MPFGTVSGDPLKSLQNAIRMMKETGADALKIEGGAEIAADIKKIIDAGIPVMGHLGLMPQSINKYGTYAVRAKDDKEAEKLISDALLLQEIGCFAIVLEKIPAELTKKITDQLSIPIIGIGAGPHADGQVLVVHDMLGINKSFSPKFLRRYADLHTVMTEAVQHYIKDVKSVDFPNADESY